MANEYYITAGLPAIDSEDVASVGTNAFYITAGLVANDRPEEAGGTVIPVFVNLYKQFWR